MQELPSLHVSKGDEVVFELAQWFAHAYTNPTADNTNISAVFEPTSAANWLRFDEVNSNLTGIIPQDSSLVDHVTVTFTAYSHETHSTSHTSLTIYISNPDTTKSLAPSHPDGLSTQAHHKMVLALVLTFALLGGLCLLAGTFAIIRRWAKVPDSALLTEEGRRVYSEKERKWYGLTLSPNGTRVIEKVDSDIFPASPRSSSQPPRRSPLLPGLDLQRVSERSHQYKEISDGVQSPPAVMPKREFLRRIKATVRQVSDKYSRKASPPSISVSRPDIGRPILVSTSRTDSQGDMLVPGSASNPFEDGVTPSRPGSTFISGSPSTSTAEDSIPRRRADFATPRNPAQVHFNDGLLVRQISMGSVGTNSFLSGKSGLSIESYPDMGPPTRPRLVPFTSSTRVPAPQALSPSVQGIAVQRMTSQRANVWKLESNSQSAGMKASFSSDALSMGIHYVRSLGADQLTVSGGGATGAGSSPTISNVRSSFTSLESSHIGNKSGTDDVMKVLIRAGERFKFRVAIRQNSDSSPKQFKGYSVKLTTGQPLPKFIRADLSGLETKGVLELSGTATFHDLGEMELGVYAEKDGTCIAIVIMEVVMKR